MLDQVQLSILTRWLPLAIVLFAGAGAAVVRALPAAARRRALAWAVVPLGLAGLTYAVGLLAPGEGRFRLAECFVVALAAAALWCLAVLWRALPGITDRRAALLLAAIALAAYLALDPFHRAIQPTQSDEPHYLLITQSLVLDGDLDLANDYAGDRYRSFYEDTLPDVHAIHVGPRLSPIRDLGLPVLSVPFFALAGRLGVMVLVSLAGAALAGELHLLLRDLAVRPRVALATAALVALLHPVLTYAAAEIEPELFAALLFVVAVRALRRGTRTSARALALASTCAGLIGIFTTRGWFLTLGLGLVIAAYALAPRVDLVRRVAAGALPALAIVLAISWTNCLLFPFGDGTGRCYFMPSAGYYLLRDQQTVLSGGPVAGLAGLFLDRTFGLISHAPLYLLAAAGLVPLVRRWRAGHGAELAPLVLAGGLLIGYIADIAYWWADGMPASRYLVAPLPLVVALLGLGIEALVRAHGRAGLALTALLTLPAIVVTGLYVLQPQIAYDLAVDVQRTGYPGQLWLYLDEHTGRALGGLWPSLVRPDAGSAAALALWLAAAALLALLGGRGARAERAL